MKPRSRDKWIAEFMDELGELRPDLSAALKFTHTLALHEWAAQRDTEPREAARHWAAGHTAHPDAGR